MFSMCIVLCTMFAMTFALKKPKEMSDEMYCLGCQVTVKELDFMLSKKPTRGMGETVTRVLQRVCDIHNFNKYDVDPKKVLQVCNHIKGDQGMEAVLITEYGRKHATGKHTTYIDMTQMICGTVLKACQETETIENSDENGGIRYDPVVEDFYIKQGKKVRTPDPVAEHGSVPNHTSKSGNKVGATVDKTSQEEEVKKTVYDTVATAGDADSHDEL